MCGIFGIVLPEGKEFDEFLALHALRLATLSQKRGTDAFGYMVVDGDGHHQVHRWIGPVTQFLKKTKRVKKALKVITGSRIFLGHTRAQTVGRASREINNHPFKGDRFILAHNGGITNHASLRDELEIQPSKPDTDSYVALALLEQKMKENPDEGIEKWFPSAVKEMTGSIACWLWDKRTKELYLFRDGNPIDMYIVGSAFVFASQGEFVKQTFRGFSGVVRYLKLETLMKVNTEHLSSEKPNLDDLLEEIADAETASYQSVNYGQGSVRYGRYGEYQEGRSGLPGMTQKDFTGAARETLEDWQRGCSVDPKHKATTAINWIEHIFLREQGQTMSMFQFVTERVGLKVNIDDPLRRITLRVRDNMPALIRSKLPDQLRISGTLRVDNIKDFDDLAQALWKIWGGLHSRGNN